MFRRTTSVVASALLLSGAAVALTPAAQAAPATFTGHLQAITGDTIVGCAYAVNGMWAGFTTNPDNAYTVTIGEGARQDMPIAGSNGQVLGVDDSHAGFPMSPTSMGYTFLSAVAPVPAGSPTVDDKQSAIWSIDPATRDVSATYVWDDSSSASVQAWAFDGGGYLGLSRDVAEMAQTFPDAKPATLRVGAECSGEIVRDVAQTITFTSTAPAPAYPGQTYGVAATGGASGSPVTFTSRTEDECTVDGSTVTFRRAGTCTIVADQAAAPGFLAAEPVEQDISVDGHVTSLDLSLTPATAVTGQRTTATAQLATATGDLRFAGGLVVFSVDGTEVDSVAYDGDGRASTSLDLGVGTHDVSATWWPEANHEYATSSDSGTVTVVAADTTTKVSVTASDLTATVAPVAPGAGTPTGDVVFRVDGKKVGTAPLNRGVAKLKHAAPAGHVVSADYVGSTDYNASSASTSRANPVLSTRVSSSTKARGGWHRTPVTVSFACDAKGGQLTAACPKPVRVTKQGATRVTRTIRTADGGVATATATVKLDRSAPKLAVTGVKAGRSYFDAPKPKCTAKDSVSGLQSCKVSTKRSGNRVVVTAKATDVAGNVRTKRVSYRAATFTIRGAKKVGGAYRVKHGETYTLVAKGARPHYVYATPAPGKPHRGSVPFKKAGKNTWALGVTMSMTTSATRSWNLGYTQNGKLHVVKVKVTG